MKKVVTNSIMQNCRKLIFGGAHTVAAKKYEGEENGTFLEAHIQ